jgi:hypothetical protein
MSATGFNILIRLTTDRERRSNTPPPDSRGDTHYKKRVEARGNRKENIFKNAQSRT